MGIKEKSLFLNEIFTPIHLQHHNIITSKVKLFPQTLSAYTAASLIAWKNYEHEFCLLDEGQVLLLSRLIQGKRHLLQPIGPLSRQRQDKLLKAIKELAYPLQLHLVSDEFLVQNKAFCAHFDAKLERSKANYLYSAKDLSELKGPHYEKKRNLIAQASALYTWQVEPILTALKEPYLEIWTQVSAKAERNEGLQRELIALRCMLENFSLFKLQGLALKIEGQVQALAIYEELNPKTAVIHFEKANKNFKGLYQLINRETARQISQQGYEFINREEDLGLQGLRQAKTSYFPIAILSSYILNLKAKKIL